MFDTKRGEKREQQRVRLGPMPKSEAEAQARKILGAVDEGTWVKADPNLTVETFLSQWLAAVEHRLALKTYTGYEMKMRLYAVPVIGKLPLSKVRPSHVLAIYDRMEKKGLSATTQLDTHRILRNAFGFAVDDEKIAKNVIKQVTAPKAFPRDNTTISPERVRAILEASSGTRLEVPVHLTALTGLRRGELLALRWECVDFDQAHLRVISALEHTRGHGVRWKLPKSKKSLRTIPLAPEAVDLLRCHKEHQDKIKREAGGAYADHGLVFPNPDGTVWRPDSFSVQFTKLASRAGCSGFRLHDLRHAAATLMIADGASVRDVSSLLGHSSPAFTLSTYAHAMDATSRAATSNLARTLLHKDVDPSLPNRDQIAPEPVSA